MSVNEIQQGRYSELLYRLLSMKEGAPSPTLAPEIMPVLVVEDPRAIEYRALRREHPWAVCTETDYYNPLTLEAGVAIGNPSGSGAIVVVERVHAGFSSLSAGTDRPSLFIILSMGVGQPGFTWEDITNATPTNNVSHRDTRLVINPGGNLGLTTASKQLDPVTPAVGHNLVGALIHGTNISQPQTSLPALSVHDMEYTGHIVLRPGSYIAGRNELQTAGAGTNAKWFFSCYGYERTMDPTERLPQQAIG